MASPHASIAQRQVKQVLDSKYGHSDIKMKGMANGIAVRAAMLAPHRYETGWNML